MHVGLTDIGFAVCALAFAGFALWLRPGTVGTAVPRLRLRLAALGTVAWTGLGWWATRQGEINSSLAQVLSIALISIWVWQLEPLARWQGQSKWLQWALRWSGAAAFAVAIAWIQLASRGRLAAPSLGTLSILGLALCALGLFTIEQVYRSAPANTQPAIRWLGLGVGGVLVTELVVFSQALLLGQVPVDAWALRGPIYALCALGVIRGARMMPDWSFGMVVSRQVAFYASSFVVIGGYLVLMSLVGWLLLSYADGWHPAAQIGFAVLAAAALTVSLFSAGLLRRLRVFISTHFYPQRYDYRAEWLRFTRTLAEEDPATTVQQRAIRAIARIVASPRGSLWRHDASGERFECAAHWPDDRPTPATVAGDDALPEFLVRTGWLVDLPELRREPQLYGGLQLTPANYGAVEDALIVPLLHVDQLYGWIVLVRPASLGELNFEDRDLLKTAGRNAAAHLAQFDADARLVQARQFETYNRMTAFVMHDLKNIAAQLKLISQNAERHRRNPEFVDDAFRTIASSAGRMSKLVSQLDNGTDGGTMQTVDLATAAERAALRCSSLAPVPQVVAQSRPVVFADMDRLASIVEHAIRNAQDATPPQGTVRVQVGVEGGQPFLDVTDTGAGMDAAFIRERLFRPFDTTKGTRGMGIGAFQIREYVTSLGGRVEVQSEPGHGTTLRLIFPRTTAQSLALVAG
jgi:putative PEP-CTERM system histidine kinase